MGQEKPKTIEVKNAAGTTVQIAVNATATVYSEIITLDKSDTFGLFWKAASGGTIGLDLILQSSPDGTNFCTIDGMPKIDAALNDSNLHGKQLPAMKAPYLRFQIIGVGSNAATTTLSIWLIL